MAAHPPAEHLVVQRACSGDRDAQQVLWRAHRRWVAAIVLAHRPRSVEVDDLMQDVAVKFVSKLPTLRDPGALRPWLRQIAVNVCRGSARRLRPTLHLSGGVRDDGAPGERDRVAVPAAAGPDGAGQVECQDAAGRLLQQVMTLPSEYREPLLLRCVRSMSYQQISEILDLPVTTVETRLARARRMLREEVASLGAAREGGGLP